MRTTRGLFGPQHFQAKWAAVRGLVVVAMLALAWFLLPARQSLAQPWQPSQQQAQSARTAVDTFLAAHDRGDAASAYEMLSDEFRALDSETSFADSVRAFNEDAGHVVERNITGVTWYKDSPGAPRLGVYAAFDMVGRFDNIDRYCGYVIAYQAPDGGPFTIMRLEQTYLDNAQARSFALNQPQPPLEEYWSQLAAAVCPGWLAPNASVVLDAPNTRP